MDVVKLFTLLKNTSSSRPHRPQYPFLFSLVMLSGHWCVDEQRYCFNTYNLYLGFGVQTPFQLILFHSLISFVPEYCYYYRQISQNGQTKHTTKCDHAPTYKDIRKLILKQFYTTLYFKNGCKGTHFILAEQKIGQENVTFAYCCALTPNRFVKPLINYFRLFPSFPMLISFVCRQLFCLILST